MPSSIEAGPTKVTLANSGKQNHNALIFRLNAGASFEDIVQVLTGPATRGGTSTISTLSGGFVRVSPGDSESIAMLLDPGTYVFVSYERNSGAEPDFAKGMMSPIEVTGTASKTDLPPGDASLTVTEFEFEGLEALRPGKHVISVTNGGSQPHEAIIYQLPPGLTANAVRKALATGDASGLPELSVVAGTAALDAGSTVNLYVDLPKGEYVLLCSWTEPRTSKLHAALGEVSALSVR